jgi:hypothetical protein
MFKYLEQADAQGITHTPPQVVELLNGNRYYKTI